jgi:hypothetical protein
VQPLCVGWTDSSTRSQLQRFAGQKAEGAYEWAKKMGYKRFGKLEGWQGPVEAAIRDTSNILHVNTVGVGAFADAARDGLPRGTDLPQMSRWA